MAASYVTAGSKPSVKVISQTEVVEVQRVNIYTKPHASFVVVDVPRAEFLKGRSGAYLEPVAKVIETVWHDGFISGTQFVQDTDPATQLLTDYVEFIVSYTPAGGLAIPYTDAVTVPVAALSSEVAFTTSTTGKPYGLQIAEAYSRLVAEAKQ